ncbi:MAG: hypothetical protein HY787_18350 [Deltaproteobacteria bacterium]|nr:hypothetical protein [Deltaproteobacteria bacterium]
MAPNGAVNLNNRHFLFSHSGRSVSPTSVKKPPKEVERKPESRNRKLFWTPAFAGVTEKETDSNNINHIDKTLSMYSRGSGGLCRLKGEYVLIIHFQTAVEEKIRIILEALRPFPVGDIYIKPVIRELLEVRGKNDNNSQ